MSIFNAKMHQIRFPLRLRPKALWGAYSASPDQISSCIFMVLCHLAPFVCFEHFCILRIKLMYLRSLLLSSNVTREREVKGRGEELRREEGKGGREGPVKV